MPAGDVHVGQTARVAHSTPGDASSGSGYPSLVNMLPGRNGIRSLSAVVLVALLAAGCAGSPAAGTPTPARATTAASGAQASPGTACATGTAPASVPGWSAPASAVALTPEIVSSQQVCGRNRLVFAFTTIGKDSTGAQVVKSAGSPDLAAHVALYDLARDPDNPVMSAEATFMWAIEGRTGVYVASVTYPEAGDWGAEFTTTARGGAPQTVRVRYQVQAKGVMPGLGDVVPSVKTATAADVGGDLKQIATDPTPSARFYQLSEDQALAQHKPFVLVFATPAFCTSQVCGPTLEKVKAIAADFPDLTFINVEPYRMQYTGGHLQPVLDAGSNLQPNDASTAFNILSEPWIYVVDGSGHVTGSFETLAGPDELKAAISAAQGH
jgi:hypothetical protein